MSPHQMTEMSSINLSDLSTELLLLIFGNFCLHCRGEYYQPSGVGTIQQYQWGRFGRQQEHRYPPGGPGDYRDRCALWSLCLTSRKLRDIAQPVLYHEFSMDNRGPSCDKLNQPIQFGELQVYQLPGDDRRLTSFIRTTADRPELAKMVKCVSIRSSQLQTVRKEEARKCLLSTAKARGIDLPAAWRKRTTCGSDYEKMYWPNDFGAFVASFLDRKGDEETLKALDRALTHTHDWTKRFVAAELVVMLITQLPRVEYFSLQGGSIWPGYGIYPSSLTSLGVTNLPLKTISIDSPASPFMMLSHDLETLNIHASTRGVPKRIPLVPNLKTLRITSMLIYELQLEGILSRCTGPLHTFVYEARPNVRVESPNTQPEPELDTSSGNFKPAQAIRYLDDHRKTLRSLHIDIRGQRVCEGGVEGFDNPRFHLRDFAILEHVLLSTNNIYNFDITGVDDTKALTNRLPESIVSLHLVLHSWTSVSRLEQGLLGLAALKEAQPTRFASLKLIRHDFPNLPEGAYDETAARFASLGVDFGFEARIRALPECPLH